LPSDVAEVAPLDPQRLITALATHQVRYVLIGALAARLQGFPRVTADADIAPARDEKNLQRLAAALRQLHARIFLDTIPEGLAFDCSAQMLERANIWSLVTDAGRLDVAFQPSGTEGYDDLTRGAVRFDVFGTEIEVARLEDILRSKEATGRLKDRQDALMLREMIRRRAKRE
jgi:hypothetical protein